MDARRGRWIGAMTSRSARRAEALMGLMRRCVRLGGSGLGVGEGRWVLGRKVMAEVDGRGVLGGKVVGDDLGWGATSESRGSMVERGVGWWGVTCDGSGVLSSWPEPLHLGSVVLKLRFFLSWEVDCD
jgi:hypothetical protein